MPKDTIHTVTGISKLSCCGDWVIQIGNNTGYRGKELFLDCDCGKITQRNLNPFIWDAKSFKPLEELPFPSLTMKEVIKKERQLVSMN